MSFHIGSPFSVRYVSGLGLASIEIEAPLFVAPMRQEGAVVLGVVPGKPALVAGVMPEADRDRLDRLPAVERHGLAVGLNLPDITSVWNRSQLLSGATQTSERCSRLSHLANCPAH
jgi:hypothetical protein